jgi:hypothetical protein
MSSTRKQKPTPPPKAKPRATTLAAVQRRPPRPIRTLADLRPDPRNANKGTERGMDMLEASMRRLGYGDAMTATRDGVVLSGNKRHQVAGELGLSRPIVVKSDGSRPVVVVRTDLVYGDAKATELAIAANRVGEVSLEWDAAVLARLREEDQVDLGGLWNEKELVSFLATTRAPDAGAAPQLEGLEYRIVVDCKNEAQQKKLLERFEREGLTCRALIS